MTDLLIYLMSVKISRFGDHQIDWQIDHQINSSTDHKLDRPIKTSPDHKIQFQFIY